MKINLLIHSLPHSVGASTFTSTNKNSIEVKCIINSYMKYHDCNLEAFLNEKFFNPDVFAWEEALFAYDLKGGAIPNFNKCLSLFYAFSTIDLLHLKRQFARHLLGTVNPRMFELYTLFLIGKYLHILEHNSINCLIGFFSPHSYGDHILLSCAHSLNISSYIFDKTSTTAGSSNPLYRLYDSNTSIHIPIQCFGGKQIYPSGQHVLNSELDDLYHRVLKSSTPYTPTRLVDLGKRRSRNSKAVLQVISSANIDLADRVIALINSKAKNKNLVYSNNAIIKTSSKYILLALHVEPEATTCPQGFHYYDQLVFINAVSAICSLFGLSLLIREHPHQLSLPLGGVIENLHLGDNSLTSARSEYFYKSIMKTPHFAGFCNNLTVANILECDSIISIASINGAIGMQAALNSKIAITGPKNWYNNLPNVFSVDELLALKTFPPNVSVDANTFKSSLLNFFLPSSQIFTIRKNGETLLSTGFIDYIVNIVNNINTRA